MLNTVLKLNAKKFHTFFFLITILLISLKNVIKCEVHQNYLGYEPLDRSNSDSDDEVALDVAIKLKPEYSDDLVSDLFAASHDLQKIARVIFFFKFPSIT